MGLGLSADLVGMPTEVYLQGTTETSGNAPVLSEETARHEGVSQEQVELFLYYVLHVTWICLLDTHPLTSWL